MRTGRLGALPAGSPFVISIVEGTDFDLKRRMFRYPCSFLIYSKTFDQLPEPILTYVERRLIEILKDEDTGTDFVHLSKKDRIAILEILMETKQGFRAKVNR